MATVTVNSFAEFVAAVAVAGDTVVLPQKAVWEMNELYPEGYNGDINLHCDTIEGNGTTINNLHIFGRFYKKYALHINGLNIKNFVCDIAAINDDKKSCFISSDNSDTGDLYLDQCIISGIGNTNMIRFSYKAPRLNRCSFNLQITSSKANSSGIFPVTEAKYCRIRQDRTSGGNFSPSFDNFKFCEIDFYCDCSASSSISFQNVSGCKITGNAGAARTLYGDFARDFPSIIIDTFSTSQTAMTYVPAVTFAQMYDASYLASLGFPVGVS